MSQWITQPDLGSYTQGKTIIKQLEATTTYGGSIVYSLSTDSQLPPGLTLSSSGVISGVPAYVDSNIQYQFSITATEVVGTVSYPNFQLFTITITNLVWSTPVGSIGVFSENVPITSNQNPAGYQFSAVPSVQGHNVVYTFLNGSFPKSSTNPIKLSSTGLLTGTPDEVPELTTSSFTIRAQEYDQFNQLVTFRDRVFSITISGATEPIFVLPSGTMLLDIEDSIWQSYQVEYRNPDNLPITISIAFGSLPPGLEINNRGLIRGYANPPVDSNNQPTEKTYDFTLEISGLSGNSLVNYSIRVKNQQLNTGFVGRKPTILNTRPLNFNIPSSDIYKPYYLKTDSMGTYTQNNNFLFKFIGFDFEGDELTYEVNGLSNIGISNEVSTGWQSGTLIEVGNAIETYFVTVRAFKIKNDVIISSDTIALTITVSGNIDTDITWLTPSDLGIIYNGQVSNKSVIAVSDQGLSLNYRIVSNTIKSNLKTIIGTTYDFKSFGNNSEYVTGTQNALVWTEQPTFEISSTTFNFMDSLYEGNSLRTILIGKDQNNFAFVLQLLDTGSWTVGSTNYYNSMSLNSIIKVDNTYFIAGNNGAIFVSQDPMNLLPPFILTNSNFNSIASNGNGENIKWDTSPWDSLEWDSTDTIVVVGDNGKIFYKLDPLNPSSNWLETISSTSSNLRSITWCKNRFVVVGDLGVIGTSPDGVNWTWRNPVGTTLNCVFYEPINDISLAVGSDGTIIKSKDRFTTWEYVINNVAVDDLYDICVDPANSKRFIIVGDNGAVLVYDTSVTVEQITSPTLVKLPPDLKLLTTGDISGRLAFESTNSVVPVGTTKTYTFNVQAYSGLYPEINSTKQFTLTTSQRFNYPYDNIYIKAMPSSSDRNKITSLLTDNNIIPNDAVYRPEDPYFGKAKSIIYQHLFGVPTIPNNQFYEQYIPAVQLNHYWRNVTLGKLKTAQARDSNNNVIYEVVYSEIVDDLINSDNQSISKEIVWPRTINLGLNSFYTSLIDVFTTNTYYNTDPVVGRLSQSISNSNMIELYTISGIKEYQNVIGPGIVNKSDGTPPIVVSVVQNPDGSGIVELDVAQTLSWNSQIFFREPATTSGEPGVVRNLYPNSLPNMREQIFEAIGRINDATILPLWMTSQQADGNSLGYTPAWVICYTKPGRAEEIKTKIETLWPYKLNQINFQLDRFEVDRSKTYNYLGAPQAFQNSPPQWATLPSAQPNIVGDVTDKYVYFPRQTILPDVTQE